MNDTMNTFGINNYHAIREANICVDGLTVLAGINGSGKSTLSRWLFYLVNGMHNFERSMRNNFIHSLVDEVYKLYRFFRSTQYGTNYSVHRERLMASIRNADFDEVALGDAYSAFVLQAENDLMDYIRYASDSEKDRLAIYLYDLYEQKGARIRKGVDAEDAVNTYISFCNQFFSDELASFKEKVKDCSLVDLKNVIREEYNEENQMPKEITFLEGKIPLIENDKFTPSLFISRAIYVDSPMAVTNDSIYSDDLWDKFRSLLVTPNKDISKNDIQHIIQQIIGGKIELVTDTVGFSEELHYISNGGVDIRIEDAATGIKSFAYLSRLLENGWLDKETLLLIDEPEAHLHPQWIVEFARLLVLIHKKLSVKVMVASHNPDMIAAIRSIAEREDVLSHTRFYLAERNKDSLSYDFVDKGIDIGDIFESFNVAMSRIQEYGTGLF